MHHQEPRRKAWLRRGLRRSGLGVFVLVTAFATRGALAEGSDAVESNPETPKFSGLAAGPEAHLFTGAATTSIPIDIPPGRKSLTPNLALTYSSGAGPSAFGHGWNLALGRVERSSRHGAIPCNDEALRRDFTVVLPGLSVECRLDEGAGGRLRCRPRVEDAHLRIYHTPEHNRWDVWDRDGLHYVFGDRREARAGGTVDTPWDHSAACRYTQLWTLTRSRDPNGNHIDITYESEDGLLYPRQVAYGGHIDSGMPHPFEVSFHWRERPASLRLYDGSAGHLSILGRLLDRIEVRHTTDARPVRTYGFHYDIDLETDVRRGRAGFLRAVTLFGRDGTALARYDGLPASTVFLYREQDPQERGFFPRTTPAPPRPVGSIPVLHETYNGSSHSETHVALRDMNGDGVLDLIDTRECDALTFPYWKVYFGSANGFADKVIWWSIPVGEAHRCKIAFSRTVGKSLMTQVETIDVNGDGIPDWVNATEQPWVVYLGRQARNDVEWGFGAPQFWQVPLSRNGTIARGLRGTEDGRDWLDLVDWNGDGLVDRLDARAGRVFLNLRTGFDLVGEPILFPNDRFRHSHKGRLSEGLFDLNGDGLLDLVHVVDDQAWKVRLHDGRQPTLATQTWSVPPTCTPGIRDKRGGDTTWRDLLDINGDGLPDIVDTCGWSDTAPYWNVYLNQGTGFSSEPVLWESPHARIREESGRSRAYVHRDLVDVDGDGLPDIVATKRSSPSITVHHNAAGAFALGCGGACTEPRTDAARVGALIHIDNGIGASTSLSYLPSSVWDNSEIYGPSRLPAILWTLTRITQDSGMGGVAAGSHQRSLEIRYAYGLFYAPTREFRGFGTVQTIEADGTTETTIFGQSRATTGRVLSVTTHAPGAVPGRDPPLRAYVNTWTCYDAATGDNTGCSNLEDVPASMGIHLRESRVFDYDAAGAARLAWRKQLAWSAYGLPTHIQAGGDGSATVETFTQYAEADDLDAGGTTFHVAKPAHVRVVQGGTVEEKWLFYDGRGQRQIAAGNLTRVESWLDRSVVPAPSCTAAPARQCVATSMGYDAYGNVTSVVDPTGATTTTEYDIARIYPARVTNALGHVVESTHDLACGKPVSETLPNSSERHVNVYDDFCRLTATLLPGQTSATAQQRTTYYLGGPGVATNLFQRTASPHSPTGWIETDDLFDGLGRRLQRQQVASVDGARVVLATDTVHYDARGNGVTSRAPFAIVQSFLAGSALYHPAPPGETSHFEYDPLGRLVRTLQPDGTERRADFSVPWQTAAMGECFFDPTCSGSRTVKIVDAHGNTVEKQVFDQDGKAATKTRYNHDFAGRVTQSEQWDGSRWLPNTRIKTAYDSLGRKSHIEDPDSGVWEFGYDLAGNLVYQDDPERNRHVELCYDALNRITQKHVIEGSDLYVGAALCANPAAATVQYFYDDPAVPFGVGRLTRVEDTTGATAFRAYDVRGNVITTEKSLRVGNFVETATTRYRYDRAGHLASIVYPDGEEVVYEYDEAGQVRSLRSLDDGRVYLADLTYDRLGRPRQITHGNGTDGIGVVDNREYHDAAGGFRLARLTTSAHPGTATTCGTGRQLLDLRYAAYTANGRIARIADDAGTCPSLSNAATFSYDALGRLTEHTTASGVARFEYNALGNMVAKDGRRFRFSSTRPHRITHIDGAAVVKHDNNGNRTQKPGFVYKYDAEDRLIEINNGTVRIAYDYSGRQVRRAAGNVTTRIFDEFSEFRIERSEPILTKHYFAGDLRIASRDVVWQPALSEVGPDSLLTLAAVWARDHAARPWVASAFALGLLGLALVPDRRRRGRPARRGPTIATLCLFLSAQLGVAVSPLGTTRAWAGGGPGSTTVPLPTVIAAPVPLRFVHYHVDHLGTPQVLTDASGQVVEHLRYRAFGEVRGRWDGAMQPLGGAAQFGFAGYENEAASGLQYAGVRWFDPDLGLFLTHDPARQYPNPYSYGGGDPINGVDRAGALFGLDDLLVAVLIGVIAGAAGSGINAAIHGASLGQALKAAAIGGALGGAAAWVGAALVAPALSNTVVPAVARQLVHAGLSAADAASLAGSAVYGTTASAGLASVGYEASRGHYAPLIGLGVAIGLHAALGPPRPAAPQAGVRRVASGAGSQLAEMSPRDLRTGDVLITRDGGMARVTEHAAVVLEAEGDLVLVLSADNRGIYTETNVDPYVGGRQWDVYRVGISDPAGFRSSARDLQRDGGLSQYLGNRGGNVCSSTVANAIEAGGGPAAPRLLLNLVTPQALRNTYGPPIGQVYVPLRKGI